MTQLSNTSWANYQGALKVARVLDEAGYEAYIIGGAVRDMLLGHAPKDYDIVTNATPDAILRLDAFKKSFYKDTAQAFGVTRVQVEVQDLDKTLIAEVEIATYRRDIEAHLGRKQTKVEFAHLEDDVSRRDFTINALTLDPLNDSVADYVNGIEDLDSKLIRFIGAPAERIQEDPLRIIRGIRLRHQLDFEYEPATKSAIKAAIKAGKLKAIATERLADELSRILTHPSRYQALEDLDQIGALDQLLPAVTAGRDVPQPPQFHNEGDVFTHTLLAMKYLPELISRRLAWATLLHDIGKPPTYTPQSKTGDRIRFSDHYEVGAQLARKVLKGFHFSNKLIDEIAWMIRYHMGIDDLPNMRPNRQRNFMSHPAFADLLELHKADAHASWSKKYGRVDKEPAHFPAIEQLWRKFQTQTEQKKPSLKDDLGIDGAWVMQESGVAEGPKLGEIMTELQEAYLDHKITSKADAKKFIRKLT